MKKYCIYILPILLSSCIATTEDIKRDILQDETLLNTISELKNSHEYLKLLEVKPYLASIEQKYQKDKILTQYDYNTLNDMPISSFVGSTATLYDMCKTHYEEHNSHDSSTLDKNDPSVVDKLDMLIDSFKKIDYCQKYNIKISLDFAIGATESDVYQAIKYCNDELRTFFCKQMFSNQNFDMNFDYIKSKMAQYSEKEHKAFVKKWEKRTGCKYDKQMSLKGRWKVLQQIPEGTLIVSIENSDVRYAHQVMYSQSEIYLVAKHPDYKNFTDGDLVGSGLFPGLPGDSFQQIGTYTYTTSLGTSKTVKKLKVCPSTSFIPD